LNEDALYANLVAGQLPLDIGVVHTVITDTAKKCAAQFSHKTGTHNNKLCFLVFDQFTDHFSRRAAYFLEQLERQQKVNMKNKVVLKRLLS